MAFNGNGTFNRIMNWTQDAVAKIKIVADRHDQQDDDFAAGLSNCLTKDGQSQPSADIPMNGKKLVNLGTPTADADAATKKYVDGFKTFTSGLILSGADANGRVSFSSATGVNGLAFTGADLGWLARLAASPKPPRLVLNTKGDGSGTDVVVLNDDGSMQLKSVATTGELMVKPTTGNGIVGWYAVDGTTKRMSLETSSGTQADGVLKVGSQTFTFDSASGYIIGPSRVYANAAYLNTDGNLQGTVWNAWAAGGAFAAINARIEARGAAFADDRISKLAYRKVSEGNSGTATTFKCPAGAVVTGYVRDGGNNGQVAYLYYMYLQAYDPVRGWVAFTG